MYMCYVVETGFVRVYVCHSLWNTETCIYIYKLLYFMRFSYCYASVGRAQEAYGSHVCVCVSPTGISVMAKNQGFKTAIQVYCGTF